MPHLLRAARWCQGRCRPTTSRTTSTMSTLASVGAVGATGPSDRLHRSSTANAATRLLAWRESLIGDLWRPGRRNAPTLRAELRRIERQILRPTGPAGARWPDAHLRRTRPARHRPRRSVPALRRPDRRPEEARAGASGSMATSRPTSVPAANSSGWATREGAKRPDPANLARRMARPKRRNAPTLRPAAIERAGCGTKASRHAARSSLPTCAAAGSTIAPIRCVFCRRVASTPRRCWRRSGCRRSSRPVSTR